MERAMQHDETAERMLLASVLLAERIPFNGIAPADFHVPGHGVTFRAMLAVEARGEAITGTTLREELARTRQLRAVGGDEALLGLTDTIPLPATLDLCAVRVRDHARLRRIAEQLERHAARVRSVEDVNTFAAELGANLAPLLTPPPVAARAWKTPEERARALGVRGARMPTGLETLDRATRGGPRSGRLVVIGGAPGAGKTSLVVQLGRWYHGNGHVVAILAADEDADGLLIRIGQQYGIARDDMEAGGDEARRNLASAVDGDRLLLVDQDEEDASLEAVVERLAALAPVTGKPGVLVVDSMQTVRCGAVAGADSLRARIDGVVAVLKHAARAHGFLVLATSEMARGYYRGGANPSTDPLASFKESGAIEYGAALALAMTNVPGQPDLLDVVIAKNRMGDKPGFRLELRRDTASLHEVARPADLTGEERETARAAAEDARAERMADEMLLALARSSTPIPGQRELRALVRGKDATKAKAVALLVAHGRIAGGNGKPYRVVPSPEATDP